MVDVWEGLPIEAEPLEGWLRAAASSFNCQRMYVRRPQKPGVFCFFVFFKRELGRKRIKIDVPYFSI
jgi:hypothetical protein